MLRLFVLSLVAIVAPLAVVQGHGRLEDPPSRATAWRYGFKTPPNYQDNELFCGGFQNQVKNGGKCGVCGDPWQGPRPHEAGGKYATGTIVRHYDQASKMAVRVHLTANHKGWMEFRLCAVNNPKMAATQDCLAQNLLTISGTENTRFPVTSDMRIINLELDLPEDLTCTQCVLQWKYHAGNSWGTDIDSGRGCIGCGPQEEFYGCADIAIEGNDRPRPPVKKTTPHVQKTTPPTEETTPTSRLTTPTQRLTTPTAVKTTTRKIIVPPKAKIPPVGWCGLQCCSVSVWRRVSGMNTWCMNNCVRGFCPKTHCMCLSADD